MEEVNFVREIRYRWKYEKDVPVDKRVAKE